jgi:O-antigen ligase
MTTLIEPAAGANLSTGGDARRSPSSGRSVALVSLFLLSAFVPLISGRATQVLLPVVVVVLLADVGVRGRLAAAVPVLDFVTASIGAFVVYAAVSALWAMDPARSVTRAAAAAIFAFASVAAAILVRREPRGALLPMAMGLWIGFLIGVVFCLFELLTGHIIKLGLLEALHVPAEMWRRLGSNRVAGGAGDSYGAINRSIATITLLLWPVLMIVVGMATERWRRTAVILLTALVAVVVMLSAHTTSKVALVLGLIVFALACWARRLTFHVFVATWIASCLAIVPAARVPYQFDLHNATWLKMSAQHRVIIWHETADQVLKAPILGRGADSSHMFAPKPDRILSPEQFRLSLAAHPHNVFLQTWLELGAVGALLLMSFGLAVLWRVRLLAAQQQPFAYAILACAGASMHTSFGMWQFWYMCLFGLATVWFALGAHVLLCSHDRSADHAR